MSSRESPRRKARQRQKRDTLSNQDRSDYDQDEELRKEHNAQNYIYWFQIFILLLHIAVTLSLVAQNPGAHGILFFHGIISPVTVVLYSIGISSAIYGYLGMYRKNNLIPFERRAQWFRYYVRSNMYFLLVWVLSSVTMIFGCWTFVYVEQIGRYFPPEKVVESFDYEMIIKQLLLNLPKMKEILILLHELDPNSPPVTWIAVVGKYFYVGFIAWTVIPAFFLFFCIKRQRSYNKSQFIDQGESL